MECLFYNGEASCYELLDFDPRGLSKDQIIEKAKKCLDSMGFFGEDADRALETVYLLEVKHLKKVIHLEEPEEKMNKAEKEFEKNGGFFNMECVKISSKRLLDMQRMSGYKMKVEVQTYRGTVSKVMIDGKQVEFSVKDYDEEQSCENRRKCGEEFDEDLSIKNKK